MADVEFVPWNPKRRDSPGWTVESNGCHIWRGSISKEGYGRVRVGDKAMLAHRARYEREVGPIPAGLELDHFACDNGAGGCCNPAHVRPVTHRENLLRGKGIASECAAKTHCPKGHPYSGDNLLLRKDIGRRNCRACLLERSKARYYANRDSYNARSSAYHAANRDRILELKRAKRAANRDEINARQRASRARRKAA